MALHLLECYLGLVRVRETTLVLDYNGTAPA